MDAILDQKAALQAQVDKVNYCTVFNVWAEIEMWEDRDEFCTDLVDQIETYTNDVLTPLLGMVEEGNRERREDFLFVLDE